MPRTVSQPLISAYAAGGVSAENRVMASDQGVRASPALAVSIGSPRSMISRRGFPTRVDDARPRAELADTARLV
jgi:hypothetical protein